jgi:hypothetical protein
MEETAGEDMESATEEGEGAGAAMEAEAPEQF